MFERIISRISSNMGLSREDAISSDLVKKLCADLVHGRTIIMDTKQRKIFSVETTIQLGSNLQTEPERPLFSK